MIRTVINDGEVRALCRKALVELGPAGMAKLMRTLASLQYRSTLDNFLQESFDGEPWQRLAEATIEGGRDDVNILHPTGHHIRRTISMASSAEFARVFTPCPWAHVHNEGAQLQATAFGDITIPRRTFVAISEEDEQGIENAVEHRLDEAIQ